jgi:hypothetical protein
MLAINYLASLRVELPVSSRMASRVSSAHYSVSWVRLDARRRVTSIVSYGIPRPRLVLFLIFFRRDDDSCRYASCRFAVGWHPDGRLRYIRLMSTSRRSASAITVS